MPYDIFKYQNKSVTKTMTYCGGGTIHNYPIPVMNYRKNTHAQVQVVHVYELLIYLFINNKYVSI